MLRGVGRRGTNVLMKGKYIGREGDRYFGFGVRWGR